jgi:hypothetical protein
MHVTGGTADPIGPPAASRSARVADRELGAMRGSNAGSQTDAVPIPPRCRCFVRWICLVDHLHPAAAVALDPQEPRREGPERLGQRVGGRGQWVVAIAAPEPSGKLLGHGLPMVRRIPPCGHRSAKRRVGTWSDVWGRMPSFRPSPRHRPVSCPSGQCVAPGSAARNSRMTASITAPGGSDSRHWLLMPPESMQGVAWLRQHGMHGSSAIRDTPIIWG